MKEPCTSCSFKFSMYTQPTERHSVPVTVWLWIIFCLGMKQAHSRLIFKWWAEAGGQERVLGRGKKPRIQSKVPFLKIIKMWSIFRLFITFLKCPQIRFHKWDGCYRENWVLFVIKFEHEGRIGEMKCLMSVDQLSRIYSDGGAGELEIDVASLKTGWMRVTW